MEPNIALSHHPEDYTEETWHGNGGATLRQLVFGMNDGLVATVGLVSGLIFAGSPRGVVVGATLAAIIAAVASMALGSYLSTRTEIAYHRAQMRRESREIDERPQEELNEMRQIYRGYGLSESEVDIFLDHFRRDKGLWLRLMLRDELGIIPESFESPWKNAGIMAFAVALGSLAPLLPILWGSVPRHQFVWVIGLSAFTALLLGGITGRSTSQVWWRSAFAFLIVAAIASGIGVGAGTLISPLFGG